MATRLKLDADAQAKLQKLGNAYLAAEVLPQIVSAAKRIAPVESGELRNSIHSEVEGNSYYVVASTPYALFVEQGTSKMPAQPYLRPALYTKIKG